MYDAALFINYKAVYNRAATPQEQANTIYWKQCSELFLDDTQATNVVVIGDYKQGTQPALVLHPFHNSIYLSRDDYTNVKRTTCTYANLDFLHVLAGKTFVLNKLSGMLLETNPISTMEGVKFKRTSWTSSDKQELNVLLIDTEGLNHLPGGTVPLFYVFSVPLTLGSYFTHSFCPL